MAGKPVPYLCQRPGRYKNDHANQLSGEYEDNQIADLAAPAGVKEATISLVEPKMTDLPARTALKQHWWTWRISSRRLRTPACFEPGCLERLLAQSSDWAFIIKTNTAVQYAIQRISKHVGRFNTLVDRIHEGRLMKRSWPDSKERTTFSRKLITHSAAITG